MLVPENILAAFLGYLHLKSDFCSGAWKDLVGAY